MVAASTKSRYDPDRHPVDAFAAMLEGLSPAKVAKILGLTATEFREWTSRHPGLAYAVASAERVLQAEKSTPRGAKRFANYALSRLPENLQQLWAQLLLPSDKGMGTGEFASIVLRRLPDREQQTVFVHALYTEAGFIVDKACQITGIGRGTFERWVKTDREFGELLRHLHECKKDFVEAPLLDLVAARNPAAVIHANRTLNRDRGYGDQLSVQVSGNIQVQQAVTLDQVYSRLSPETLEELLRVLREVQAIPVEATVVPQPQLEESLL